MRKRTRGRNLAADPLRSGNGDKEWRDWSNLPSELVADIADLLLRYDAAEYLRLRAACKEWRNCTDDDDDDEGGRDPLDKLFRPRRWTMLSNNTDGARRRFLDVGTGACYIVDLPELSTHHLEATTEGLLLLRHKTSHAARLLNPLTRALIDLPPIAPDLDDDVHDAWTRERTYCSQHIQPVYAGISDETSPATVVLMMRSRILCARPGVDKRWTVMGADGWRSIPPEPVYIGISYRSTLTLRGRVYLVTLEGNILQVEIRPGPAARLVPVVLGQPLVPRPNDVSSYLVPADHGMLMVRYYRSLGHLGVDERKRVKRRVNTDAIKLANPYSPSRYLWHMIEVFEVDLDGKSLVPVHGIGHRRAVFVGEAACLSLSTEIFPSVAGNAVYIGVFVGVNGFRPFSPAAVGVRYMEDKSFDPPFEFIQEERQLNLVPFARPCTLQEYLVCCTGFKDGMRD